MISGINDASARCKVLVRSTQYILNKAGLGKLWKDSARHCLFTAKNKLYIL